jgi:hypothetical protein
VNRKPNVRLGIASIFALAALLWSAGIASAHEHRDVGEYTLNVGFLSEPAIVDEPNGVSLGVVKGHDAAVEDSGTPVEGLADTLKAEVSYGGETKEVELQAVFGTPGAYKADLFPTKEGAYTFRFFGTIEGTGVDESFTSGPETFDDVVSTADIAFPAVTDDADVQGSAVANAQDAADSARTLAIVGIAVGALGLLAGAVGLYMAMRDRPARAGTVTETTTTQAGD